MLDKNIDDQDDIDPEESLRMDNKIKRLELELKGAKFLEHNPDGIQLPPEIESQMLDQILEFEKMKLEAREVEIYDFLGKPKFKNITQLSGDEIILEKERILQLMSKKGIILTSVEEIDDSEMYRFITEEFFHKKMLDMPVKGFVRHFVYEEYYPNERLNAQKTIEFFFQAYFNESDNMPITILCREEIHSYLVNFKSLYARFELKEFHILETQLKKIKGKIQVHIEVEAFIENSLKSHIIKGDIQVEVKKRKGFWQISHLEFPKID